MVNYAEKEKVKEAFNKCKEDILGLTTMVVDLKQEVEKLKKDFNKIKIKTKEIKKNEK